MLASSNPKLNGFPNPKWTIQTYKKSTKKTHLLLNFAAKAPQVHTTSESEEHTANALNKKRGVGAPSFCPVSGRLVRE